MPEYTLTMTATVGGTTVPTLGAHTYTADSTVSGITPYPDLDYSFSHWILDGVNVGAAVPYSLIMDTDHTLHAVFTTEAPPPPAPPIDIPTIAGIALAITDAVLIAYLIATHISL